MAVARGKRRRPQARFRFSLNRFYRTWLFGTDQLAAARAGAIRDAFADYYRATILADETDPNKLHDLQADLDGAPVYSPEQIDDLVERYLGGAERDSDRPDPRHLRGGVSARPG